METKALPRCLYTTTEMHTSLLFTCWQNQLFSLWVRCQLCCIHDHCSGHRRQTTLCHTQRLRHYCKQIPLSPYIRLTTFTTIALATVGRQPCVIHSVWDKQIPLSPCIRLTTFWQLHISRRDLITHSHLLATKDMTDKNMTTWEISLVFRSVTDVAKLRLCSSSVSCSQCTV